MMARYRVYGATLASEIPFPDLPPADDLAPARWTVRRVAGLPPMNDANCLGREPLYRDVEARLFSHRDGWRIEVDDTGSFDLAGDGTILAAPLADAWDDFVRAHLLGRVLAVAQYRGGLLPLHASAVSTAEGTIAFLGPKGVGKTSLAAALVQAGAGLVTDDTVPIEPATPPLAWPGLRTLRLRSDTHGALGIADAGAETREGKRAVTLGAGAEAPAPLAALFLLAPSDDAARVASARRVPFSPVLAAAAVTAHVKCGRMLGHAAAGEMLARVARIVHLVPVHQLSVTRDLARLPDAAATILGWYGGAPR